jgi:hypothetical protein
MTRTRQRIAFGATDKRMCAMFIRLSVAPSVALITARELEEQIAENVEQLLANIN